MILGIIWSTVRPEVWQTTKATGTPAGREIFERSMLIAHTVLYQSGCTTVRMWKGLSQVPPLTGFENSEIIMWLPAYAGGDPEESPQYLMAEPGDLTTPIRAKSLAQDLELVAEDTEQWKHVCFVQFLAVKDEEARSWRYFTQSYHCWEGQGYQG